MNIPTFLSRMDEAGDAYIYYVSPVSKKVKYHIGTLEVKGCAYIEEKYATKKHSPVGKGQVKVFCWDLDDFKNIELAYVTKVVPLQEALSGRDD